MHFNVFTMNGCAPCKALRKVLDSFVCEYPEVKVVYIDVDQNPGLAQSYGVYSVPTILSFDDAGNLINSSIGKGSMTMEKIKGLLNF